MINNNRNLATLSALVLLALASCSSDDDDNGEGSSTGNVPDSDAAMSFFLTSAGPGDGGNLGGLAGADVHCANLAEAAGTIGADWRAYLSTSGADGENAIERIGAGPWVNANGVTVATDVANLVSDSNNITKETAITESGDIVNGRGDTPNRHDILTGTELNGFVSLTGATCANWTSNNIGSALVGHHDREGGGTNPTSWSTAHPSAGCSQSDLIGTGGDGLFYCFAL